MTVRAVSCLLLCLLLVAASPAPLPVVFVDRDNVQITQSCTVRLAAFPIPDRDDNGVVQILGEGIEVDFGGGRLRGAELDVAPDRYEGIGVTIEGRSNAVRNLAVSGFRIGVNAKGADGLTVEDADLSDNFRQRLRSTTRAEDQADWLWPHENDEQQWLQRYGAALAIRQSDQVTVRRVRVRNGQNGIVLERVTASSIYDNDCSFLSGWGLALWRSSGNTICRNAFDFCIRGYSHGVYNRGQDSAGILLFEQCSDNVVAENSATHGGDGLFAFAGRNALGQTGSPHEEAWYRRRGNNDNLFAKNDFSYAAAHGLELTFSFGNGILDNRFVGNAICGIWGGYSSETLIQGNTFEDNGAMGYGAERGGINIEHGRDNRILDNGFARNACGVRLWWDQDSGLSALPWTKANGDDSENNLIARNRFREECLAIELREDQRTMLQDNSFLAVERDVDADQRSQAGLVVVEAADEEPEAPDADREPRALPGVSRPVGARSHLRGREHIVLTEWGPWDHRAPMIRWLGPGSSGPGATYEFRGREPIDAARPVPEDAAISVDVGPPDSGRQLVTIRGPASPGVYPYRCSVTAGSFRSQITGTLINTLWTIHVFPWSEDPRDDQAAWRRAAESALSARSPHLLLEYGSGGPSQIELSEAITQADIPIDRFGTIATTTLDFPRGFWEVRTRSDDGIRLWMDNELVIDDWSWHPPREHRYDFEVTVERQPIEIRVEHFEIDGFAVLEVEFVERQPHGRSQQ